MSFDLERIEEAARAELGDGQKPVEVDAGEALWDYLDCENDEGYGCGEDCHPGRQAALDSLRHLLTTATTPEASPVSASELLALVEVVKAAREVAQSFDCSCPDYQKPYHPRHHPDCLWDEGHDLRAALRAFGDEQGSSSGGAS